VEQSGVCCSRWRSVLQLHSARLLLYLALGFTFIQREQQDLPVRQLEQNYSRKINWCDNLSFEKEEIIMIAMKMMMKTKTTTRATIIISFISLTPHFFLV